MATDVEKKPKGFWTLRAEPSFFVGLGVIPPVFLALSTLEHRWGIRGGAFTIAAVAGWLTSRATPRIPLLAAVIACVLVWLAFFWWLRPFG
jgi:hypothetical protein